VIGVLIMLILAAAWSLLMASDYCSSDQWRYAVMHGGKQPWFWWSVTICWLTVKQVCADLMVNGSFL